MIFLCTHIAAAAEHATCFESSPAAQPLAAWAHRGSLLFRLWSSPPLMSVTISDSEEANAQAQTETNVSERARLLVA